MMGFSVNFRILILILFCLLGFLSGCTCSRVSKVDNVQKEVSECEDGICKPPEGY